MSQTKIYSVHSENTHALTNKIDNLIAAICTAKKFRKMYPVHGQYGTFEVETGEENNFIVLAKHEGLGVEES